MVSKYQVIFYDLPPRIGESDILKMFAKRDRRTPQFCTKSILHSRVIQVCHPANVPVQNWRECYGALVRAPQRKAPRMRMWMEQVQQRKHSTHLHAAPRSEHSFHAFIRSRLFSFEWVPILPCTFDCAMRVTTALSTFFVSYLPPYIESTLPLQPHHMSVACTTSCTL